MEGQTKADEGRRGAEDTESRRGKPALLCGSQFTSATLRRAVSVFFSNPLLPHPSHESCPFPSVKSVLVRTSHVSASPSGSCSPPHRRSQYCRSYVARTRVIVNLSLI